MDEEIFDFVCEHEPNAREFIDLIRLNGEIMERLFEGNPYFQLVLELEQKMASHARSRLCRASQASPPQTLHQGRVYEYNETLAEVHLCWSVRIQNSGAKWPILIEPPLDLSGD